MAESAFGRAADRALTLGGLIHAAAKLPDGALERIRALEEGRHPSLEDLRAALGDSLDLGIAIRGGVSALADGTDDAHLAAAIDAAYRALEASRLIRAEITSSELYCWRDPATIALGEGEALVLVIMADNRTDATIEFSAEAHGEGIGGYVEAGRTGSSLLSLGALPAGSYLVPLLIVAAGRTRTIDLPIECGR
jgi:hypothetical protein